MKCPKCSHENLAQAQFCAACGEPLNVAPAGPNPDAAGGSPISKEMKVGILIGTIFVPLLGIIMGAIYMSDPNPAKKEVGRLWLMVGIGVMVLSCVICGVISALGNMAGANF